MLSSLPWALQQARRTGMSDVLPLAPHQLEAVALGHERNAVWSLDMGTGKSACAILLAAADHSQPAFVVPPSIVPTWIEELAKWTPRRQVVLLRGVDRPQALRVMFDDRGLVQSIGQSQVFPTDWLILVHPSIGTWYGLGIRPDLVCYDEVHRLSGYSTKDLSYVLSLGLQADRAVCMSGTLMAGGAHRLWVPCHLGDPRGGWGTYRDFATRYAGAQASRYGFEPSGVTAPQELRERMAPFTLHYDRHQVGLPVPPHHVIRSQVYLSQEDMRTLSDHSQTLRKYLRSRSGQRRSSFLPAEVQEALIALGRATVSSTVPYAQDVVEAGRRVVCWVWHREIAEELSGRLRQAGVTAPVIHGGYTDSVFESNLRVWQSCPSALCITMALGGEGWNVLARHASDQIFVELPWLPEILCQAMARLVRPGQLHPVLTRLLYLGVAFQASIVDRLLERHHELGQVLSAPDEVEDLLLGVSRDRAVGMAEVLRRMEI